MRIISVQPVGGGGVDQGSFPAIAHGPSPDSGLSPRSLPLNGTRLGGGAPWKDGEEAEGRVERLRLFWAPNERHSVIAIWHLPNHRELLLHLSS